MSITTLELNEIFNHANKLCENNTLLYDEKKQRYGRVINVFKCDKTVGANLLWHGRSGNYYQLVRNKKILNLNIN